MRDRVAVVAKATFLEAVRDRVLLVSVAFAIALMLFSRVLGWLSIEDTVKVVQDVGLSGLSVLAILLAMLVGAQSLAREVERRTIYTVLSRDCTRTEFVLGKFVGLVSVFWAALTAAAVFLGAWIAISGGAVGEAVLAAVAGILCETIVLTAVALFLGALANPAIAAIGTLAFYLAGHMTEALREMIANGRTPEMATLFEVLYRVVPNLETVNFINHTTSTRAVHWADLGVGALVMVGWAAAFLAGATLLFRRRQF
jgi:ABC-type transport system involved in multi-copper enzyme maturation permease subunit